jgi:hypothetical protein
MMMAGSVFKSNANRFCTVKRSINRQLLRNHIISRRRFKIQSPVQAQIASHLNMPPSFIIVGATGNTGRAVAETLSAQLQASSVFATQRILALTRSAASSEAQKLGKLPHVEFNWP